MIKKIAFLFSITIGISAFSQPDNFSKALMNTPFIAFEDQQVNFRDATVTALSILITADQDTYTKDWKNWLKMKSGVEGKKNSGYYSTPKTIVPSWSADSLTIHYKIEKDGDATRLFLLLQNKQGFLDSVKNPDDIIKVKTSITEQVKSFYVKYYDEKIADQQKYYDLQVGDIKKLEKKGSKIQNEINNNEKSIQKNEDKQHNKSAEINKSEGKLKALNAQLEHEQKAVEQANKEEAAHLLLMEKKQAEYNKLNADGALDTREGIKVMKELEKLKSKNEKLLANTTKANEAVTKSENAILSENKNKTKLLSSEDNYKRDTENHGSKISKLKNELERNAQSIKDAEKEAESARVDLDKLKTAKGAVMENPLNK